MKSIKWKINFYLKFKYWLKIFFLLKMDIKDLMLEFGAVQKNTKSNRQNKEIENLLK